MDNLTQLPYLYLTTTGWKSGRVHEIEIWFTALNGRYYVISERYEQAHWVQNIRRDPGITFRLADRTFMGTGRVVDATEEPELHAQVCALSEAKYGWGEGLVVELTADQ